jgi:hypothetical protein
MCDRKASQTFFQDGALLESGRVLLYGTGRLTDVVVTGPVTAATTPLLVLRDGAGQGAKILVSLTPTGPVSLSGLNLEFQESLWLENTPGAGPLFGKYSVGAYIEDTSPDPQAQQLERIRDAMLEMTRQTARLAQYLDRLFAGDPSA